MFERFTRDARRVVTGAEEEATAAGSPTIEAEHLLLALARGRDDDPAARALRDAGLDAGALAAALERETERSLAAVGVAAGDFALGDRTEAPGTRTPRIATSAKRALERALRAAVARGDRRIVAAHVLLGVLRADVGTVPRALELAEVDRIALATRVERALG